MPTSPRLDGERRGYHAAGGDSKEVPHTARMSSPTTREGRPSSRSAVPSGRASPHAFRDTTFGFGTAARLAASLDRSARSAREVAGLRELASQRSTDGGDGSLRASRHGRATTGSRGAQSRASRADSSAPHRGGRKDDVDNSAQRGRARPTRSVPSSAASSGSGASGDSGEATPKTGGAGQELTREELLDQVLRDEDHVRQGNTFALVLVMFIFNWMMLSVLVGDLRHIEFERVLSDVVVRALGEEDLDSVAAYRWQPEHVLPAASSIAREVYEAGNAWDVGSGGRRRLSLTWTLANGTQLPSRAPPVDGVDFLAFGVGRLRGEVEEFNTLSDTLGGTRLPSDVIDESFMQQVSSGSLFVETTGAAAVADSDAAAVQKLLESVTDTVPCEVASVGCELGWDEVGVPPAEDDDTVPVNVESLQQARCGVMQAYTIVEHAHVQRALAAMEADGWVNHETTTAFVAVVAVSPALHRIGLIGVFFSAKVVGGFDVTVSTNSVPTGDAEGALRVTALFTLTTSICAWYIYKRCTRRCKVGAAEHGYRPGCLWCCRQGGNEPRRAALGALPSHHQRSPEARKLSRGHGTCCHKTRALWHIFNSIVWNLEFTACVLVVSHFLHVLYIAGLLNSRAAVWAALAQSLPNDGPVQTLTRTLFSTRDGGTAFDRGMPGVSLVNLSVLIQARPLMVARMSSSLAFLGLALLWRIPQKSPLSILAAVMRDAATDLLPMVLLLIAVGAVYAFFGYILFGKSVPQFSTPARASTTMFELSYGEGVGINEIVQKVQLNTPPFSRNVMSELVGPIFVMSFSIAISMIMLNIFVAIAIDSYARFKLVMSDLGDADLIEQCRHAVWARWNRIGAVFQRRVLGIKPTLAAQWRHHRFRLAIVRKALNAAALRTPCTIVSPASVTDVVWADLQRRYARGGDGGSASHVTVERNPLYNHANLRRKSVGSRMDEAGDNPNGAQLFCRRCNALWEVLGCATQRSRSHRLRRRLVFAFVQHLFHRAKVVREAAVEITAVREQAKDSVTGDAALDSGDDEGGSAEDEPLDELPGVLGRRATRVQKFRRPSAVVGALLVADQTAEAHRLARASAMSHMRSPKVRSPTIRQSPR